MNTLRPSSGRSLGIDLYLWVTYRTFTLALRCGSPGVRSTASSESSRATAGR